jgi:hypothetical protein
MILIPFRHHAGQTKCGALQTVPAALNRIMNSSPKPKSIVSILSFPLTPLNPSSQLPSTDPQQVMLKELQGITHLLKERFSPLIVF